MGDERRESTQGGQRQMPLHEFEYEKRHSEPDEGNAD
jgi:hypothetical protein